MLRQRIISLSSGRKEVSREKKCNLSSRMYLQQIISVASKDNTIDNIDDNRLSVSTEANGIGHSDLSRKMKLSSDSESQSL